MLEQPHVTEVAGMDAWRVDDFTPSTTGRSRDDKVVPQCKKGSSNAKQIR